MCVCIHTPLIPGSRCFIGQLVGHRAQSDQLLAHGPHVLNAIQSFLKFASDMLRKIGIEFNMEVGQTVVGRSRA